MSHSIVEKLKQDIVIGDGGYVYILRQRGLPMEGYAPQDILTHEDEIRRLTQEFIDAGAEVIQAQTFGGSRNRLEHVGEAESLVEINRKAVNLAKQVTAGKVPVAGSISSLFGSQSTVGQYGRQKAIDDYREQCGLLVDLGVDFLILETFYFLDDALTAMRAAEDLTTELMVTMAFEEREHTRDHYSPGDCARALTDVGADVVGLNCMIEPQRMLPFARQMREAVATPLATQPIGFRCWPEFTHLHEVGDDWPPRIFPPQLMADYASQARDIGVNYIGACCGAGPHHIAAMAEALGRSAVPNNPSRNASARVEDGLCASDD